MATTSKRGRRYRTIAWLLIGIGASALAISLLIYGLWFSGASISEQTEQWGTFGDYVGGVAGTIIALATLIAVAYALDVQDRELTATRQALERQLFDTRFFQLLERFTGVSAAVSSTERNADGPLRGRAAIEHMYDQMRAVYPIGEIADLRATIVDVHRLVYKPHEPSLGPYFRTLYHVFKLVDRQTFLSDQEKIDYSNIARAQLSRLELALLFYNGLSPYGAEFKPLIEKYGILKHLNEADLPDTRHKSNQQLYAATAFMSQDQREAFHRAAR